MNTRFNAIAITALAALFVGATKAQAQVSDSTGTGTVNVQSALSLALVASPSWGKVTRPPSGTARYTLDYSLGGVSLTSGDGYAFNDGQAGEFTLSGAASAPVSFSVSFGAFAAPSSGTGVSLVAGHINGTSASGTGSLSVGGALTLKIGGVIDVTSTASLATHSSTVTVTADYQ